MLGVGSGVHIGCNTGVVSGNVHVIDVVFPVNEKRSHQNCWVALPLPSIAIPNTCELKRSRWLTVQHPSAKSNKMTDAQKNRGRCVGQSTKKLFVLKVSFDVSHCVHLPLRAIGLRPEDFCH